MMAEQLLKNKSKHKPRRPHKGKGVRRFNKALQPVLDLLPYGPISLNRSKTTLQYFGHSVQSEGYPLLTPPITIRIAQITCSNWKKEHYALVDRLTLERDIIRLTYLYDLVQPVDELCTPLITKAQVEVVTLRVGHDMVFSTHATLMTYGKKGVRKLSEEYKTKYGQYTDMLSLHTGGHACGYRMDYVKGCLIKEHY